jgi:ketosteroid isomerase-like protein
MKNLLLLLCLGMMAFWTACTPQEKAADEAATTAATADTNKVMAAQEIGDAKYTDIMKKQMASFAAKDVNAYMSYFADNAVYYWNNGDSLAGKPAIQDTGTNSCRMLSNPLHSATASISR